MRGAGEDGGMGGVLGRGGGRGRGKWKQGERGQIDMKMCLKKCFICLFVDRNSFKLLS